MNGGLGVVHGGWGFVQAAYIITLAVFTIYTLSVVMRLRAGRREADREAQRQSAEHG